MTLVFRHAAVETALLALFPAGVTVAAERVGNGRAGEVWPEEHAAVAGAVPSRQAEFAAGRIAARRCLAALGHPPVALPAGKDRAAIWPPGIFGSISHAGGIAVAVACKAGPVGVDIEADAGLEPDLWPVICTAEELAALPESDRGRWVRHVFSAKEAVFKSQDPERRAIFGFDAVTVRLVDGGFRARFRGDAGGFSAGQVVPGRLATVRGLVLTGVAT